jgi:hypothetical protein
MAGSRAGLVCTDSCEACTLRAGWETGRRGDFDAREAGGSLGTEDKQKQQLGSSLEGNGAVERGVEGVCWRGSPFTCACRRAGQSGCGRGCSAQCFATG